MSEKGGERVGAWDADPVSCLRVPRGRQLSRDEVAPEIARTAGPGLLSIELYGVIRGILGTLVRAVLCWLWVGCVCAAEVWLPPEGVLLEVIGLAVDVLSTRLWCFVSPSSVVVPAC